MKHILSIDYGSKVIGLARYRENDTPFPLSAGRIIVKSLDQVLLEIKRVVEDEFIDTIVIGIPKLLDGQETAMSAKVRVFMKQVESYFQDLIIHEVDETLSTIEAKERMQNSPAYNFRIDPKKIDEVSAIIILESFLKEN